MRVLYYNVLQDYATITATNEDGNYPIESIFNMYLTTLFQTTSDQTIITITFDVNQIVDSFVLAYTNLGDGSTVDVVYRNSADAILLTENLEIDNDNILKSYFTQLTTVRSITITITNIDSSAVFYIGTIWIGEYLQLPDIRAYPVFIHGNADGYEKSVNGQVSGQIRGLLRGWNIEFPVVVDDEILDSIYEYINTIGNLPHFVDFYDELENWIYYCHILVTRFEHIRQSEYYCQYKNYPIQYEEAL